MGDAMNPLDECREELASLVEENQHLRESANTFADLAERLRASLERERQLNSHPTSAQRRERKETSAERRERKESGDPADENRGT
jgi:hypothetical protein